MLVFCNFGTIGIDIRTIDLCEKNKKMSKFGI